MNDNYLIDCHIYNSMINSKSMFHGLFYKHGIFSLFEPNEFERLKLLINMIYENPERYIFKKCYFRSLKYELGKLNLEESEEILDIIEKNNNNEYFDNLIPFIYNKINE